MVAETCGRPAGSEIVMPVTVSGPLFVTTTIVHLMLLPASTGFGEPTFDTARSMSGEMTDELLIPARARWGVAAVFTSPE